MSPSFAESRPGITDEKYAGVGGWLLVLIVYLTILNPLGLAMEIPGWHEGRSSGGSVSSFFPWTLFAEHSVVVLLGAFGFYAGISLWRKWPGADRLAKVFAILFAGNGLAVIAVIGWMHVKFGGAPDWRLLLLDFVPVFLGAACFLYLVKSKRVAATYESAQRAGRIRE